LLGKAVMIFWVVDGCCDEMSSAAIDDTATELYYSTLD